MYFGLTPLGVMHTAISLVAVAAGDRRLSSATRRSPGSGVGKVYVWTTVLTCLTGFGIFQHGGFGKPHMLGILTLVVLGIAVLAGRCTLLGRASAYMEMVGYSLTFFFHMIPGVTETFTRFPAGIAGLLQSRRSRRCRRWSDHLRPVPDRRLPAGAPPARREQPGAPAVAAV